MVSCTIGPSFLVPVPGTSYVEARLIVVGSYPKKLHITHGKETINQSATCQHHCIHLLEGTWIVVAIFMQSDLCFGGCMLWQLKPPIIILRIFPNLGKSQQTTAQSVFPDPRLCQTSWQKAANHMLAFNQGVSMAKTTTSCHHHWKSMEPKMVLHSVGTLVAWTTWMRMTMMFSSPTTNAVYSYNDNNNGTYAGHYFANAIKKSNDNNQPLCGIAGWSFGKNTKTWVVGASQATQQQQFLECLQHGVTAAAQADKTKQNQPVWHSATTVASPKQLDAPGKKISSLPRQWLKATRTKKPKQQLTCVAWHPPNDAKVFHRTGENSSLCIWHGDHQCSSSSKQKNSGNNGLSKQNKS